MKHRDPLSHVITTNLKTVQISQKMSEVHRLVVENQIHHVPVVDGRRLVGMISTTDIIRLNITVSNADDWTIGKVMKKNLVTIEINDTVRKAAHLLSDGMFHWNYYEYGFDQVFGRIVLTLNLPLRFIYESC